MSYEEVIEILDSLHQRVCLDELLLRHRLSGAFLWLSEYFKLTISALGWGYDYQL